MLLSNKNKNSIKKETVAKMIYKGDEKLRFPCMKTFKD